MLYLKKQAAEDLFIGIWKIEETMEELFSMLKNKEYLTLVDEVESASRKIEILAARVLIKELLSEEKEVCYHRSGKPYLKDHSFQISISHTRNYAAVALSYSSVMGLDIEQRSDKIFRVRDRITTKYDYIDSGNEQVHLLLYWSAKEAMFKYLTAEGVDFRRNLHVEPFVPADAGVFNVSESKTNIRQAFYAHYLVAPDFVLVCLEEQNRLHY